MRKINIYLSIGLCFALGIMLVYTLLPRNPVETNNQTDRQTAQKKKNRELPCSFALKQEQYDSINGSFLKLKLNESLIKLPDLRPLLLYYGKNLRPDSLEGKTMLLFGIRGDNNPRVIVAGEKNYLVYDSKNTTQRWNFSENNQPTPLWFIAEPNNEGIDIQLQMKSVGGEIVEEPSAFSHFFLKEIMIPPMMHASMGWRLGNETVDATLLAKHKVQWYGEDLFLKAYGGEEYRYTDGCQRVLFETEGTQYARFIKEGDALCYENGYWLKLPPGPETQGKPLLLVKKVNEKSLSFELWDEEGKRRFPLELQKSQEPPLSNKKIDIKLVGARSKKTCIVEIFGSRTHLAVDDWLIFTGQKYEIVKTAAQLDAYIDGETPGELLILEGMDKDQEGSFVNANLFSLSHAETIPLRIEMQKKIELFKSLPQGNALGQPQRESGENQNVVPNDKNGYPYDDDEDYDDDDYDDDYDDDNDIEEYI